MSSDPNLASQLIAMRTLSNNSNNNVTSAPAALSGSESGQDKAAVSGEAGEDKTKVAVVAGASSYRDFSHVLPEKHNDASSLIAQSTTAKEPTFPVKLHMILSNPEFQDIM